MGFYKPQFLNQWLAIYKSEGFKVLLKKKGWSVIIAIVLFYLVRDTFLYILLPYLALLVLFELVSSVPILLLASLAFIILPSFPLSYGLICSSICILAGLPVLSPAILILEVLFKSKSIPTIRPS